MRENSTAAEPAAERAATEQLEPGERLLWFGRPARHTLEWYTMRAFVFGLLSAVGVCLAWILYLVLGYWSNTTDEEESALYSALRSLGPTAVGVAAGVLALAVLAGFVGLVRGRWLTSRTVYAVTDRRVLFIEGGTVRWIGHRELRDAVAHQHRDGTGDVVFIRDRSSLELVNANRFSAFPRDWWGAVVERFRLSRLGVDPPQDPGVREAFVGISNPRMVRDVMLASLKHEGRETTT